MTKSLDREIKDLLDSLINNITELESHSDKKSKITSVSVSPTYLILCFDIDFGKYNSSSRYNRVRPYRIIIHHNKVKIMLDEKVVEYKYDLIYVKNIVYSIIDQRHSNSNQVYLSGSEIVSLLSELKSELRLDSLSKILDT